MILEVFSNLNDSMTVGLYWCQATLLQLCSEPGWGTEGCLLIQLHSLQELRVTGGERRSGAVQHTSPSSCWHQVSSAGTAGVSAHSDGVSRGSWAPRVRLGEVTHSSRSVVRAPCAELCLLRVLQDSCGLVN